MPSGKKSKQARRAAAAPPPVVSKGMRRRQADPRVLWIGAAVVAAIVVAIVLGIVLTGGGSGSLAAADVPATGSLTNALPGASDVRAELKGIPQQGLTLGDPKAPVTLTQYIDLQCPICRELETATMPDVIKNYVRTGKVRIETRVLKFIGADSVKARAAMLAAAKQNKAYDFALVLYANQGTENTGWLTDTTLSDIAASVPGLNVRELWTARKDPSIAQQGAAFDRDMVADKVSGTPSLFVGPTGTKGSYVNVAANDYATLAKALDAARLG